MLAKLKQIKVNVLLLALVAHLIKMIAISPGFPDAIVFLGLIGLYGFYLRMESMKPRVTEADKLRQEVQQLKDAVTKATIKDVTKPPKYF